MSSTSLQYRLNRVVEKNAMDARAFLLGRMPSFIAPSLNRQSLPVFCFHDVEREAFECQLRFLRDNGYRTLIADEIEDRIRDGRIGDREVALTFDDATSSFWTYAYPLLKHYGFRAILFAVPTMLVDDVEPRPNWDDVLNRTCEPADLKISNSRHQFCTWQEVRTMSESGYIDVQSHSLTHVRVPISSKIIDYLSPGFPTYYGNFDIPISSACNGRRPSREINWGAPLFNSDPLLAAQSRFSETPEFSMALQATVLRRGGAEFFRTPNWRSILQSVVRRNWPDESRGHFLGHTEISASIHEELKLSKRQLEMRLPGKEVTHFCYPWFRGSTLSDRLAADTGYRAVFYGSDRLSETISDMDDMVRVQRVGEEFLYRLPGSRRKSLRSILISRLRGT